jgi:two-component system response regulator FixJ
MSASPVLVYIIEDDPEQRMMLHEIVEPRGFRARTFGCGEDFLTVYHRLSPGIILLDLKLPGISGGGLMEELVRRGCWWPASILTAHPEASEVERALRAGAIGVLHKPIKGAAILAMLEDARKRLTASRVEKPNPGIQARFATLTPGERAVLDGLRAGLLVKQIAAQCGVSERTVRSRVKRILQKTGADSREHLLQLAVTAGLPVKQPA